MPVQVISSSEAAKLLTKSRRSIWPARRRDGRLGDRVICELSPSFSFSLNDKIFTAGSCFARNIERRLSDLGFDVPMRNIATPEGDQPANISNERDNLNKYTAQSIANELAWAFDANTPFPVDSLLQSEHGLWHDPHLHPEAASLPMEDVKRRRDRVVDRFRTLPECRIIVLTMGLVEEWYDNKLDLALNGLPPKFARDREPSRFVLRVLSHADVLGSLTLIYELIRKYGNPDFRILITVSPVPFRATFTGEDAIVANTYSKSVLRAAVGEFVAAHDRVDYFPSYEMVTLSDRKSAYVHDNIHVRPDMVARIMDQVICAYVPEGGPRVEALAGSVPTHPAHQMYLDAMDAYRDEDAPRAVQILLQLDDTYGFEVLGVFAWRLRLIRGVLLLGIGETAKGEGDVLRAIEEMPSAEHAHRVAGGILERGGQNEKAAEQFERAFQLSSEAGTALRLSKLYRKMEDREAATRWSNCARSLSPG